MDALRDLLAVAFEVHPSQPLVADALAVSLLCGCSVYDGVYLVLAERQDCRLITADRRFVNAMQASGRSERIVWIEQDDRSDVR